MAGLRASEAEQTAQLRAGDKSLRPQRHEHDQGGGKSDVAPIGARAQHLRQQRKHCRAQQWPEHGLSAAEQHIEHDRYAERDVEILRLDEAEVMRVEAAANTSNGRTERK